ncbi:uncharacterized protein [Chelonus insularis]|uniref:uncharacterized protein n=1 Tax=Chelonus insularis TaxID=460826 RepID=UPI001589DCE2|nr:uncharacterized protein LOC118064573 [Chelonus insularis]
MLKYFILKSLVLWFYVSLVGGLRVKNVTSTIERHIRSITFPNGSGMGIFFAVGIPLDLPGKSVSMAYYFEANYQLPDKNSTYFNEYNEYFQKKSFSRTVAYKIIENKLERAGYSGRKCLLRTICEAASTPITGNGLIGDIIHILFTPSSSENENLSKEIIEAEYEKNCSLKYNCTINFLDLISHYVS